MFKDIPGYEGLYAINEQGEVLSYSKGGKHGTKVKSPHKTSLGYLRVRLWKDNKVKNYLVHRLVAITFIPNPKSLQEVNHKNLDKTDNRIENLEWCTRSDNCKHAYKKGAIKNIGEIVDKAAQRHRKLTFDDAEEIRRLYKTGEYSYADLKNRFNVCRPTIADIVHNKIYKNP